MMEYVVWTSGRHCKSFRNSEYFPDQPLMYERFRKEKIVEAKVAKSAGNGNVMGMMDTIVTKGSPSALRGVGSGFRGHLVGIYYSRIIGVFYY